LKDIRIVFLAGIWIYAGGADTVLGAEHHYAFQIAASENSAPELSGTSFVPGRRRINSNWVEVNEKAKVAVKAAIGTWCATAKFKKGIIRAPTLLITTDSLEGLNFEQLVKVDMSAKGIDAAVAGAYAAATWESWRTWSRSFTASYPAFPHLVAVSSGFAAPTPGIKPGPPLAGGDVSALQPERVSRAILAKLNEGQRRLAAGAVRQFSEWFWERFKIWQVSSKIMTVIGAGPVPGFSPPYSLAGPVVNGYLLPASGAVQCGSF